MSNSLLLLLILTTSSSCSSCTFLSCWSYLTAVNSESQKDPSTINEQKGKPNQRNGFRFIFFWYLPAIDASYANCSLLDLNFLPEKLIAALCKYGEGGDRLSTCKSSQGIAVTSLAIYQRFIHIYII